MPQAELENQAASILSKFNSFLQSLSSASSASPDSCLILFSRKRKEKMLMI